MWVFYHTLVNTTDEPIVFLYKKKTLYSIGSAHQLSAVSQRLGKCYIV